MDIGSDSDANVVMNPKNHLVYDQTDGNEADSVAGLTTAWYEQWVKYGYYQIKHTETGSHNGRQTSVTTTWTYGSVTDELFAGTQKYIAWRTMNSPLWSWIRTAMWSPPA